MNDLYDPLDKKQLLDVIEETHHKSAWQRFVSSQTGMIGLILLSILLFFTLFGPYLTSFTHLDINLSNINKRPGMTHWFGTDDLGRDLFTRLWMGARISLFVGIGAAFIDLVVGVLYGSLSALFGRKVDEIMMRFSDVLYAVPHILMMILFITVFGNGLFSIMLALTLAGWINMARIVRSKLLEVKERDFVQAALVFGSSKRRIILKHLIPNSVGIIITTVTYSIPSAIFTESFLSFLGLGLHPPAASWGILISEGIDALQYYPWRLVFPAIILSLTIYAFNAIGDALRDAFDPQRRHAL